MFLQAIDIFSYCAAASMEKAHMETLCRDFLLPVPGAAWGSVFPGASPAARAVGHRVAVRLGSPGPAALGTRVPWAAVNPVVSVGNREGHVVRGQAIAGRFG